MGVSNHYGYLKIFLPSRHYYKGDLPYVAVFVDDKKGDLSKAIQLIFLFFFISIMLCTFLLLIYFIYQIKRKVIELEKILSNLGCEKKLLTPNKFFDRYTRITEVINGLLSTLFNSIEQKDKIANSKFELYSQLTHDIRTPLTSIQTSTETLFQAKRLDDFELNSLRTIINMDVDYLTNLVDDLLFLSLLETPHRKETEFKSMIEMLDTLVEKHSSSERIFQSNIMKDDLSNLYLPHFEFLRLMNNLLSNAFRYSKKLIRLETYLVINPRPKTNSKANQYSLHLESRSFIK